MTEPTISVIVPCFNGEQFLKEALESVLAQGHDSLEIIVCDDGSTDNSAQIAHMFRAVRYIHNEHRGLPATLNSGLEHANGTIIGFIDADDIWPEGRLAHQINLLNKNSDVAGVVGRLQRFFTEEKDGVTFRKLMNEALPALSLGAALFRKNAFDTVGHFDVRHSHGNDIDWFMRAKELGQEILSYDQVSLLYRRHENNMSNDQATGERYLLGIARQALLRRRRRASVEQTPGGPNTDATQ